jgi:uncharacterized protein YpbB
MRKIEDNVFEADMRHLKGDVGFQSRFSYMTEDYVPIVERVYELEKQLEAITKHLSITVVRESYTVTERGE